MKRMLSGIKPSGDLTLGNYIGAIRQYINYQNEYEMFIFIADLHAITVKQDPKELHDRVKEVLALYLACGLDPEKVTLFVQSENPYHANLGWILECHTYMGELSRMTQFKDKTSKENNDSITCGLFTYPALMAADIIIYDADFVPVGEDQKQHVELTRNIVDRFNNRYGEIFKVPTPVIPKVGARIKDLQNPEKKMSKSGDNDKGYILLLDDLEKIRKKIMSAVTDSDASVKFDEANKPGVSNLITIYSALSNKSIQDIEKEFEGKNYGEFKKAVADTVISVLEPIQKRYNEILNGDQIDEVLNRHRDKVIEIAKNKVDEVKKKVGLGR